MQLEDLVTGAALITAVTGIAAMGLINYRLRNGQFVDRDTSQESFSETIKKDFYTLITGRPYRNY